MRSITSNRGSALIVALIFAAIISISLTSYLKLSVNSSNLSNRSFYMNAAINLVDTGFERAIWSLSDARFHPAPANWVTHGGFTQVSATEYYGTLPNTSEFATGFYPLSGNAKGQVRVRATVDNPSEPNPAKYIWKTVAEATITLGDNSTLKKMGIAYLQQRSYFGKGMVAKDGVDFEGNGSMVDSWISRPTTTADWPYDTAPYNTSTNPGGRRAEATVAGLKFIALDNGDIFGYVSIGSSTISNATFDFVNGGTLNGDQSGTFATGTVVTNRVTTDFSTNFPEVDPIPSPSSNVGQIKEPVVFTGNSTIGTTDVKLAAGESLEIGTTSTPANITLVVIGDVDLSSDAAIVIHPGSSLIAYVGGDIKMTAATSIRNGTTTQPANPDRCQFFGTGTVARDWTFNGAGYISAAIYAPYNTIKMAGSGAIYGSVVGNIFKLAGGGAFHQDESLSNLRSSGIWGLTKFREITTATERATYASQLNF
jgi:hypothetical protein